MAYLEIHRRWQADRMQCTVCEEGAGWGRLLPVVVVLAAALLLFGVGMALTGNVLLRVLALISAPAVLALLGFAGSKVTALTPPENTDLVLTQSGLSLRGGAVLGVHVDLLLTELEQARAVLHPYTRLCIQPTEGSVIELVATAHSPDELLSLAEDINASIARAKSAMAATSDASGLEARSALGAMLETRDG